ncbi:MAG: DUF3604 domain-containing protein [Planctomycetota bacterium]|jgi:hypothetical protein
MDLKNRKVDDSYEVGAPFEPHCLPISTGSFEIGPHSVRCDKPYVLTVSYTVGKDGITEGGGLMIRAHAAQFADPDGKKYLAVSCSNEKADFSLISKGYPRVFITTPDTTRPNVNWHAAVLSGCDLAEGDVITFTVGTEKNPLTGPERRKRFADTEIPVMCYLDADGTGKYITLSNSPTLDVTACEGENLHAYVRSTVRTGERIVPRGAVTDKFGNLVEEKPEIEVCVCDGSEWGKEISAPENGVVRPMVRTSLDGVEVRHKPVQTTVTLQMGDVLPEPKINPVKTVGAGDNHIFWGDIHFHSNFSQDVMFQGIENTPDECYRYGRDVMGLDFACLTDHHEPVIRTNLPVLQLGLGLTEELWQKSKQITEEFNKDNEFVTFFGCEYRTRRGDTNIYFRDCDNAPYLPGQLDAIAQVHNYCRDLEFFSAPHLHPYSHQYATLAGWKWGFDVIDSWQQEQGSFEPVMEVFSRHGRYEFYNNQPHRSPKRGMTEGNSAQAHLMRGHRFGLYAGSDDHWGRPGMDGLMAVYAPDLTRNSIFEAIKKRRVYATTNARIILEFHANDSFMGEECFSEDYTRIKGKVYGTDVIEKIEVIRDSRVIHTIEPGCEDAEFEFEDSMRVLGTCFYYLRVTQRDKHMAWSSPVWVTSRARLEDMHGDLFR